MDAPNAFAGEVPVLCVRRRGKAGRIEPGCHNFLNSQANRHATPSYIKSTNPYATAPFQQHLKPPTHTHSNSPRQHIPIHLANASRIVLPASTSTHLRPSSFAPCPVPFTSTAIETLLRLSCVCMWSCGHACVCVDGDGHGRTSTGGWSRYCACHSFCMWSCVCVYTHSSGSSCTQSISTIVRCKPSYLSLDVRSLWARMHTCLFQSTHESVGR